MGKEKPSQDMSEKGRKTIQALSIFFQNKIGKLSVLNIPNRKVIDSCSSSGVILFFSYLNVTGICMHGGFPKNLRSTLYCCAQAQHFYTINKSHKN